MVSRFRPAGFGWFRLGSLSQKPPKKSAISLCFPIVRGETIFHGFGWFRTVSLPWFRGGAKRAVRNHAKSLILLGAKPCDGFAFLVANYLSFRSGRDQSGCEPGLQSFGRSGRVLS